MKVHYNELSLIVDGNWSTWEEWNDCSATCGGGQQHRTRSCSDPKPQYGGKDCNGQGRETKTCSSKPCPSKCD